MSKDETYTIDIDEQDRSDLMEFFYQALDTMREVGWERQHTEPYDRLRYCTIGRQIKQQQNDPWSTESADPGIVVDAIESIYVDKSYIPDDVFFVDVDSEGIFVGTDGGPAYIGVIVDAVNEHGWVVTDAEYDASIDHYEDYIYDDGVTKPDGEEWRVRCRCEPNDRTMDGCYDESQHDI